MDVAEAKVREIHKTLNFSFGNIEEELPEQIITAKYLKGDEKVLEIGGNIGRNSMIIASILNKNNNHNYVTVEMCPDDYKKLEQNRSQNNLNFTIVNGAISKRPLIAHGWSSYPFEGIMPPDYYMVNTITWNEFKKIIPIEFDTLIADCEGALFYILQDTPEILDNIKLIIVENDYFNNYKQAFVENIYKEKGFVRDYYQVHPGDANFPNFFEVWIRN